MDIEKTIDYLENVMSSEVRKLTLENEIKRLNAVLNSSNEYYVALEAGNYDSIYYPPFGFSKGRGYINTFNPESFGLWTDAPEGGKEIYETWMENCDFYARASEIEDTIKKTIEGLPVLQQAEVYESYERITFPTSVIIVHFINACIDNDAITATGGSSNISLGSLGRKSLPAKSQQAFEQFLHTGFSPEQGYVLTVMESYKGLFGKTKYRNKPQYSDSEINIIAQAVYPLYIEKLNVANDFLTAAFDRLIDSYVQDSMQKDEARKNLPLVQKTLDEEQSTLGKLYGLNVIYEKYRNIIAVGSFIDFFASGRCNDFVGPEGAYNLYESEIRLDRITDKLDIIIQKLNEIEANQRAVYLALQEMQQTQQAMISSVNEAADRITGTIKKELSATNASLSDLSTHLQTISSSTASIDANQKYANHLLEISNEQQKGILRNQEFEQMLFTDPSIFGGRVITDKAYRKYH